MSRIQWIRTAFWQGKPKPGMEQQWRHAILTELLPAFRATPGVHDAKACWPDKLEDHPPEVACQFIVEFASRADLDRMLASPERAAVRANVKKAVALFEGHISHIEYRVD
jgi:quinol monooxygenase YgiN